MKIQHNLTAINANRNLKTNNNNVAKNLEKLSTGHRINRSADDAAGLAISEKMRAQITGLDQAAQNAEDGISLVQSAEGAMSEIHTMLNRMMGLAIQSANGTYSSNNRSSMQQEVQALLDEITRIEKTCSFNGMPILQGNDATVVNPPYAEIKGGLPAWVNSPQIADGILSGNFNTEEPYIEADSTVRNYTIPHAAAYIDFSGLNAGNVEELKDPDTGFYSTCCTCSNHYSIKFVDGNTNSVETSGSHYIYKVGLDGVATGEDLVQRIVSATGGKPQSHFSVFVADPAKPAQLIVYDERISDESAIAGATGGQWQNQWDPTYDAKPLESLGRGVFGKGVAYHYNQTTSSLGAVILQIGETGAESNRMVVDLPDMALDNIGIAGISVEPRDAALAAIAKLEKGIDYVSIERGRMGSYQNRLEHTIGNLNVQHENIGAAESRIRDVDMAKEVMAQTKNSILVQTSQSMLAQANMSGQGVLQLLQ